MLISHEDIYQTSPKHYSFWAKKIIICSFSIRFSLRDNRVSLNEVHYLNKQIKWYLMQTKIMVALGRNERLRSMTILIMYI